MGKITNSAIRSRQPSSRLANDPNLQKSTAAAAPATGDVAAGAAFRATHERAHGGLELSGDVPALYTASMDRRPHPPTPSAAPVPNGGVGFVGNATTD